jgi:6-phosphogluconolactonase/glucosamine-6-phosphate isomerase/deaminase
VPRAARVVRVDDGSAPARAAADEIATVSRALPAPTIVFATGETPLGTFAELPGASDRVPSI